MHFNPTRQLYIDIDASKERGFGAMIYHLKHGDRARPTAIDPILFLSKCLTPAEARYWPTELEMAGVVWVIRKVHHMVRSSQLATIVWTDHSAIPSIAKQVKLSSSNVDKLNLRLMRASTYLSQFNIAVKHKARRDHVIPDALSQLPARSSCTVVELSDTFKAQLLEAYKKREWSTI